MKTDLNKKILVLTVIIFAVSIFTSTPDANAQRAPTCGPGETLVDNVCERNKDYVLLAPINEELKSFDPTKKESLGNYLNIMIKIFIGICAVLAMVMIVMGGLEYMTSELISEKAAGKQRITNAVLGLLLALGAYLILATINKDLLNTDIDIQEAQIQVEIDMQADVAQAPVNGRYGSYDAGSPWNTQTAGAIPSINAAQAISVRPICNTVGQQGCTSLRRLDLRYVNIIATNCSACLPLEITGGTEFWLHGGNTGSTTHQLGSPTVDLRLSPALTNYITGGQPLVRMKRYEKDGISFLYEGNHWHAGR